MAYSGSGESEILDGVPPTGRLRSARPAASASAAGLAMPRPSAAAMALTGAGPTGDLAVKMMTIEKLVMDMTRQIPELANAFAPAIEMMRTLGAERMASQAAGGLGATNPEAAASPAGLMNPMGGPMMGQAPMGGPAGGAGGGMGMPPMPLML